MTAPVVTRLALNGPQTFLWLKSVESTRLDVHCARSLVGNYVGRFGRRLNDTRGITGPMPLPDRLVGPRAWYLCGVDPRGWATNSHLAFTTSPGDLLIAELPGMTVEIEHAARLDFDESDIAASDPNTHRRAYRTCRNWQFAHALTTGRWAHL